MAAVEPSQIIGQIETLTREPGYVHALCWLLHSDCYFPVGTDYSEINPLELLNFSEFDLLCGFLIKRKISLEISTDEVVASQMQRTRDLLQALHDQLISPFQLSLRSLLQTGTFEDPFKSGRGMLEPIFYGPGTAHLMHLIEMSVEKYEADEKWLEQNRSLRIRSIPAMFETIRRIHNDKFAKAVERQSPRLLQTPLETFCFSRRDLQAHDAADVEALIANFSCRPGTCNESFAAIGQRNFFQSNPVVALDDDLFFLPNSHALAKSIYESPFYWMMDDSSYKPIHERNRGNFVESAVYRRMLAAMGDNRVYRNVFVVGPRGERKTDIDVLGVVGSKCIVAQCKAKGLTEAAKRGDEIALLSDFAKSVQHSYEQGILIRNSVLSGECSFELQDGTSVDLKERINDIYVLCVLSEDYPALTIQADHLLIKKNAEDPPPLAVTIFDLGVLVHYLNDPYELAYYIRQRIRLSDKTSATCEAAYLGFHLKHKLFLGNDGPDLMNLDEQFARLVDVDFLAAKGWEHDLEDGSKLKRRWRNDEFERLVSAIKEIDQPRLTDALFFLYDLSSSTVDFLINQVGEAVDRSRREWRYSDMSALVEDKGISFLCGPGSAHEVFDRLSVLCRGRKYKSKANMWLGLGRATSSRRAVDCILFSDRPWTAHDEDERFSELLGPPQRTYGPSLKEVRWNRVGRNDPCPCKSGKKYKKCCLPSIDVR